MLPGTTEEISKVYTINITLYANTKSSRRRNTSITLSSVEKVAYIGSGLSL